MKKIIYLLVAVMILPSTVHAKNGKKQIIKNLNELNLQVDLMSEDLLSIKSQFSTSNDRLKVLEGKTSVLENKLSTLENQVSVSEGKITAVENKQTLAESEITNLKEKDAAVGSTLTHLQKQIQQILGLYYSITDNFTPQIDQLKKEIAELKEAQNNGKWVTIMESRDNDPNYLHYIGNIGQYYRPMFNQVCSYRLVTYSPDQLGLALNVDNADEVKLDKLSFKRKINENYQPWYQPDDPRIVRSILAFEILAPNSIHRPSNIRINFETTTTNCNNDYRLCQVVTDRESKTAIQEKCE